MAKLTLRLKTFIPDKYVFYGNLPREGAIYYGGDNRNSSWNGTYRTIQEFTIDTSSSEYSVSPFKDTGTTYEYFVPLGTNDYQLKKSKKASTTGLTWTKEYNEKDDCLYLKCKCSVANPLVPLAPAIDYDVTLKITRVGSVRITGKHDGFPAYEFWRKFDGKPAQLVYLHDPRETGHNIGHLGGTLDVSVDQGLSYDA